MRVHRFYIADELTEKHELWVNDQRLLHQWAKVLRYREGDQLVLFDGHGEDRLYKIDKIDDQGVHLVLVTQLVAKTPRREVYLLWSLLKKDKNDWVIQKCTEIGVTHFMPIMTSRTEKTGFDVERSTKIAIEAAEQCGRSDIPIVHEVRDMKQAITELKDHVPVFVCDERSEEEITHDGSIAIVIGPEGGWDEAEIAWFMQEKLHHAVLGSLTLRAETAAVVASSKLLA